MVQARRIQIVNRSGDVIVDLAGEVSGSGIIAGYDNLGNNVFYAGVSRRGGGYLSLQDGSGNVRVVAIAGADEDDTSQFRIKRSTRPERAGQHRPGALHPHLVQGWNIPCSGGTTAARKCYTMGGGTFH